MKIELKLIGVDSSARIRQDNGDIEALKLSISEVGLLNPIVVDETYTLIAGFRRYTACKELGMEEIEVTVLSCKGDKQKLLEIEMAENLARKDFTIEEIELAAERRREIEEELKGGFWQRLWQRIKDFFAGDKGKAESEAHSDKKSVVEKQKDVEEKKESVA